MRYVVIDTTDHSAAIEVAGQRGTVLGTFDSADSARCHAARWRECGNPSVVVVDTATGGVVGRGSDAPHDTDAPAESETRPVSREGTSSIPVARIALRRVRRQLNTAGGRSKWTALDRRKAEVLRYPLQWVPLDLRQTVIAAPPLEMGSVR